MQFKPGHLAAGPLVHKQTPASRTKQSSRQQYNEMVKRMKPVDLGWKSTKGEVQ